MHMQIGNELGRFVAKSKYLYNFFYHMLECPYGVTFSQSINKTRWANTAIGAPPIRKNASKRGPYAKFEIRHTRSYLHLGLKLGTAAITGLFARAALRWIRVSYRRETNNYTSICDRNSHANLSCTCARPMAMSFVTTSPWFSATDARARRVADNVS